MISATRPDDYPSHDSNHEPDSTSLLWGYYEEWLEAARTFEQYPSDDVAEEVAALDMQLHHEIYKIRRGAMDRVRIRALWNGEILDARETFKRAIEDALKYEADCKNIKPGSMPRRVATAPGTSAQDAKYDAFVDDN